MRNLIVAVVAVAVVLLYCAAGGIHAIRVNERCKQLGYFGGENTFLWFRSDGGWCLGERNMPSPSMKRTPLKDAEQSPKLHPCEENRGLIEWCNSVTPLEKK